MKRREEILNVFRFFYDLTFHPNLKGVERIGAIIMTSIFSLAFVMSVAKLSGFGFLFGI